MLIRRKGYKESMRGRVAAITAVALAASIAAACATGRSAASSSCAESWTSAVSGRPSATAHGIYVWRARGIWHLSLNGAPAPLVGKLSADAPVRVAHAGSTLEPTVSSSSRSLKFRVSSPGSGSLAFRSSCARKLNFSFAAATRPHVFLGHARRPVSPSFLLSHTQTTGVSGQIYSSGGCPVVKIGEKCPSAQPVHSAMRIDVMTPSTSKSGGQPAQLVKTITSAADGSYSTTLDPGRYLLQSEGQSGPGGTAFTPVEITVAPGVTTVADLTVDTGIR